MALGDLYVTAVQLKAYLGITDSTDDTAITDAVNSITEEIDEYCGRQFNLATSATARVYEPRSHRMIEVDDIASTSGLVVKVDTAGDGTYATTIAAANYQLRPLNGVVDGRTGWPYTQIEAINYCWPTCWQIAPIQVTAIWGWAAVPKAVILAAYIAGNESFGMRGARFGVANYDQWGPIRVKDNPIVRRKLDPYRRHAVLAD